MKSNIQCQHTVDEALSSGLEVLFVGYELFFSNTNEGALKKITNSMQDDSGYDLNLGLVSCYFEKPQLKNLEDLSKNLDEVSVFGISMAKQYGVEFEYANLISQPLPQYFKL